MMNRETKNLVVSSVILGMGLMGALDGIVFHQFLQWHHVIDHHNHRIELFSDGVFNLFVTLLLFYSCVKIFRDAAKEALSFHTRAFAGSIVIGAGAFNLLEGLIDHQILGLHHVRPASANWLIYDMVYLLSGIVLIVAGFSYSNLKLQRKSKA
ncbi:DUF2243 domain-containing protein [Paenibacillus sp. GCM10023248]|uniref:DUF2243 domain-containing protein n=1 Tax=Bacillales TaxID=1385 RepID=UPI002379C315|nr:MULTISPECIES: DUF2243 domain-containing protein [Bacillales]MDD9265788.1 DUF2243 domain-containing protein [Paenibacillus sp. MAHUQ-63]MDR6879029.1 putative membrane protein [Bacillus sp. 3255]